MKSPRSTANEGRYINRQLHHLDSQIESLNDFCSFRAFLNASRWEKIQCGNGALKTLFWQ